MSTKPSFTLADLLLRTYRLLEDVPFIDPVTANVLATPASGLINLTMQTPASWPAQSRIELDDEIFLVDATANGSNPVPVQRAYESTVAAAHTSGTLARKDPRFLHATVTEAINVVVGNWCSEYFPQQVWDTATAGTFTPVTWVYTAPADALSVLRCTFLQPGITRELDVNVTGLQQYPTSVCSTGYGFEVTGPNLDGSGGFGLPGRTVNVLYAKRWPYLALPTDALPADWPAEADDLIPIGAVLYIAGARTIPRWRTDEITFYREQATNLPSVMNVTWLRNAVTEWYQRAQAIRNRRPTGAVSQKIYRGSVA